MFYVWQPRPPENWLAARRSWAKFVRDTLSRSRTYDTELQVARACAAGDLVDHGIHESWKFIRDTFTPNTVPVWLDDTVLCDAAKWLEEPGICWVEHVAVGERLATLTGLPYFGRGGLDAKTKTSIEAWNGKGCIASIAANNEGRNLQAWSRSYIMSMPPSGAIMEQLLGRCHRDGQEADEVSATIVLACREQFDGFMQARRDAEYIGTTTGQQQKLQIADYVNVPTEDEVARRGGPLWEKRSS
jgi:hypothetical protein